MTYLVLRTSYGQSVRFSLYDQESPNTCREISRVLPLKVKFVQGRFAGEEIYSSEGPLLELPAENATINLKDGEIGFAPVGE
ncbi:MAG: DUF3830 family protein, partial [Candidatus Micrarchaeota archaeon]|nr:DUF3830 family protein [Candidatus Micrarchaeota archaeon]